MKLVKNNFQHNESKLYHSRKWRTFREEWMKDNYFCVNCGVTRKLCLDHIFEFGQNEYLFWEKRNLQTLCISCHLQKTTKDKLLMKFENSTINLNLLFNIEKEQKSILLLRNFYKTRYIDLVRNFDKEDEIRFNILNLKVIEFKELVVFLQKETKTFFKDIEVYVDTLLKKNILI